jgi:hypothetical protein
MDEGLNKIRHARSKKDFPALKLEDDEFVEFAFTRAKIFLFTRLIAIAGIVALVLLVLLFTIWKQDMLDAMGKNFMYIIVSSVIIAAVLASIIMLMLFRGNKLFITNKRVIQTIMLSPVSTSLNIIDLSSVEDASFSQNGLMQKLFHYGTLRLSTVGDETTYTFTFSDISPNELKEISKLISESKKKKKGDEIIIY